MRILLVEDDLALQSNLKQHLHIGANFTIALANIAKSSPFLSEVLK
ncbi:hypothetical protein [Shewanella sp. UCD-KL12]